MRVTARYVTGISSRLDRFNSPYCIYQKLVTIQTCQYLHYRPDVLLIVCNEVDNPEMNLRLFRIGPLKRLFSGGGRLRVQSASQYHKMAVSAAPKTSLVSVGVHLVVSELPVPNISNCY